MSARAASTPSRFSVTYGLGEGFAVSAWATPQKLAAMAASEVHGRRFAGPVRLTLVLGAVYTETLPARADEPLHELVLRWARSHLAGSNGQVAALTPNVIDFLDYLVDVMVDAWIATDTKS